MENSDKYGKQETMFQKSMRLLQEMVNNKNLYINKKNISAVRTLHEAIDHVDEWKEKKDKNIISCKCSACGKEYNPEDWPNSWRCSNCF